VEKPAVFFLTNSKIEAISIIVYGDKGNNERTGMEDKRNKQRRILKWE